MFEATISLIKPLDEQAMEKCQIRLDNLTKPLGSLHSFEHIARKMAGITGQHRPKMLEKSIIIMAADHGVLEEDASLAQSSLVDKVATICQGNAPLNIFAMHANARLLLVDIGMKEDLSVYSNVHHEKIAWGTNNITQGPAMTKDEGTRAIMTGIRIAQDEIKKGSRILGLGTIGRGSILSSIGIVACYSSQRIDELLRGDNEASALFQQQKDCLSAALAVNTPDITDALDVLCKMGGLEIAGLVGVILGAAAGGAAVILDGLTTSAAALIAMQITPKVKDYIIASHFALEPAHKAALELMEIPGYLHLDMDSNEGIGSALGMSIVKASLHVINDMKTFGEAEVPVAQDGPGALKQDKNVKE